MNIAINSKNLSVDLTKQEILVINTIIDEIDFISLKKIIANKISEEELIKILESLFTKKVVKIDNPSLLNIGTFNRIKSLTYLYSNANLSEQIDNLCKKIKNKDNYYSILNVSPKASLKDIKMAYYKLSKRYHPDIVNKYNLPKEKKQQVNYLIIELSNIFNVLKIDAKRRNYDKSLDMFKKKVLTVRKSNVNQANIDKGKEYFVLADNEYHNRDYKKAMKLIKLSLSYNSTSKIALKLKADIEVLVNKENVNHKIRKIDELILMHDFKEAFDVINDIIMVNGDKKEYLFKKIEILTKLNYAKNRNKIISLLEDIISGDKTNIRAREQLIECLKSTDEKALLKKHAEELLKIDSKNKIAKKYIKGKLWNIF